MRFLLDTNVLLPLVDGAGPALPAQMVGLLQRDDVSLFASVASVWEVALKHRLGKLTLPIPLAAWPAALEQLGIHSLTISTAHVIGELATPYRGKDPFDRLLLGVCSSERLRLLTRDAELLKHPLAWRPGSA